MLLLFAPAADCCCLSDQRPNLQQMLDHNFFRSNVVPQTLPLSSLTATPPLNDHRRGNSRLPLSEMNVNAAAGGNTHALVQHKPSATLKCFAIEDEGAEHLIDQCTAKQTTIVTRRKPVIVMGPPAFKPAATASAKTIRASSGEVKPEPAIDQAMGQENIPPGECV